MSITAAPDPSPACGQKTDHYYLVSIRPREAFIEFRTPLAGDRSIEMDHPGYDVREGRIDSGTWLVQCVLVPLEAAEDAEHAEQLAAEVVRQLET